MNASLYKYLLFVILIAVLFTSVLLSNRLFNEFSFDLTENKVFTLSEGTEQIISGIDEPINFYYFFSDNASSGATSLRNYAQEVEAILEKYSSMSNGKIVLQKIDPEPFSESEDQANAFGLSAANYGNARDPIYFGLAATNSLDDTAIISFFDPAKSSFLEYELSKLVFQLSSINEPVISVMTSLPLGSQFNPITGQEQINNVAFLQLSELFDVVLLDQGQPDIPLETQVLVLWHPKELTQQQLYNVDQYLMKGGNAIVLFDPHFESEALNPMSTDSANSSELELLPSYGIDIDTTSIVLDASLGLDVLNEQQSVIRHLAFIGLNNTNIDDADVATANLESINGAAFGAISLNDTSALTMQPLLTSSSNSTLLSAQWYSQNANPAGLNNLFKADPADYVLGARFSGSAQSHFNNTDFGSSEGFVESTDELNMVVIADVDIFADRFWVQQSSLFGQVAYTPFANNADLLSNLVENYAGHDGLVGIRSRGAFSQPFTKVEALSIEAESIFREQEQLLQTQLLETEQQLMQLQNVQAEQTVLSQEQEEAIEAFIAQRLEIRKELRDVQYQLDKDIDRLGNALSLINIVIAPILLVIILYLFALLMRKKSSPSIGVK